MSKKYSQSQMKLISDAIDFSKAQDSLIEFVSRTYIKLKKNPTLSIEDAIDLSIIEIKSIDDENILRNIQRGCDSAIEHDLLCEFLCEFFDITITNQNYSIEEVVDGALWEWDLDSIFQDFECIDEVDQCIGCPEWGDCIKIPSFNCLDNEED